MVCIHCGAKTRVINSRPQKRQGQIWRRRACTQCGTIFTTEEAALFGAAWLVRSSADVLQPFMRDRLFLSLYRSLEHRDTAIADAGALTNTITQKLVPAVHRGILDAKAIEHAAEVALQRFDKAASIHYQAHHRHS